MSKKLKAKLKNVLKFPSRPKLVLGRSKEDMSRFQILYMDRRFRTESGYSSDHYDPQHYYEAQDHKHFKYIFSESYPQIFSDIIYLQGSNPSRDDFPLLVSSHNEASFIALLKDWASSWEGWGKLSTKDYPQERFSEKMIGDFKKENLLIFK